MTHEDPASAPPAPPGGALPGPLHTGTVLAMAVTCGFSVANIYYNQPMMADMARSFGVPEAAASAVPTATQIGYAAGLFLLAPLGDRFERRGLILVNLAALVLALVGAAAAPSFAVLTCASLLVGMLSTAAQQVVPMAAHLASPERRGRVIGTVMSGLLVGILGARTLSGFVAELFDWRAMFWIAAGLMAAIAALVRLVFPRVEPTSGLTYPELLGSLWTLFRSEPVLREASGVGALIFGSFSVFWSTLTLYLASPAFLLGPAAAGLFGLVGIAGVLAAPLSGRLADKGSPRQVVGLCALLTLAGFVCFALLGASIAGLVLGVLLLDLGVQGAQISNQSRIYALRADARSRLNTVYMTLYFIGGALGSAIGSFAWSFDGWAAVSVAGIGMCLLALAVHCISGLRRPGTSA